MLISEKVSFNVQIPALYAENETILLAASELETLREKRFGKTQTDKAVNVFFRINQNTDAYVVDADETAVTFEAASPIEILYAVYDFAEEFLDYCFFEPGHDTIASNSPELKITSGRLIGPCRPLLKRRGFIQEFPFSDESFITADWMAKNKLNYVMVWMKYYDVITPELKETFRIRGIEIESGHHNFSYWIPGEKYAGTNPEFFAIINGKRISPSASKSALLLSEQLCTTNLELRREMVNRMKAYVKEHPELKTISLIPNDGFGWCECDECSKFYDKNKKGQTYSVSSHVYKADRIYHDLINDVSEQLHKDNPDIKLTFCAYVNYTSPAPGFKLAKNTAVHFAPYWRCVNHNIYDKNCWINSSYYKDLNAWIAAKDGGEVNIYEYIMGINFYISLPLIMHETIFDEIKEYSRIGVDGFLTQFHIPHWVAYGANFYMMAKALYGADKNKTVADFFRKVFGSKSSDAKKIYDKLLAIQMSSGPCLVTYPRSLFKRTKTEDYRELHQMACTLAKDCNSDFARRLALWTEYLLKFKELFDKYQDGKVQRCDVETFIQWCKPLKAERVLVHEKLERLFEEWLKCIDTGKEWIHFNLDWEDKYIKLHDTLLNDAKPDLKKYKI